MLQVSEEVNQQLKVAAPLIVLFGLPEKEQIAVLPVLEKRKYDFPEGDLITSNALEVLMSGYKACLDSLLTRLMIVQDEPVNRNIEDLVDLVERLLEITHKIESQHFEVIDDTNSFGTAEWKSLRQLSSAVQQKLGIQLVINTKIVENCVKCWLHP